MTDHREGASIVTDPKDEEASVREGAYNVRVAVRGWELTLTTQEARAFARLMLRIARRVEKRNAPQPEDQSQ